VGEGEGSQQLSGFPIISTLTSEVVEMGGDMNRWLLTRLAWTSPDTKALRIWKGKFKRGKLAGGLGRSQA
jgi:hypothetical protein